MILIQYEFPNSRFPLSNTRCFVFIIECVLWCNADTYVYGWIHLWRGTSVEIWRNLSHCNQTIQFNKLHYKSFFGKTNPPTMGLKIQQAGHWEIVSNLDLGLPEKSNISKCEAYPLLLCTAVNTPAAALRLAIFTKVLISMQTQVFFTQEELIWNPVERHSSENFFQQQHVTS